MPLRGTCLLRFMFVAGALVGASRAAPSYAQLAPDAPVDAPPAEVDGDGQQNAPPDDHMGPAEASGPSESEIELARTLYYDGIALLDQQQWEGAADRFERVLAIRDSVVVSFQLANAYASAGRQVDAHRMLQRVLNDPEATPEMLAAAGAMLADVEAQMGRLTVRLQGAHEGVRVLINGHEIPLVALDVPVPVDPGEVTVVVERDGAEVASGTVQVGGAMPLEVDMGLEVPPRQPQLMPTALTPGSGASGAAPIAGETPAARDDGGGGGLLSQWWFWTAVGVVTTGAVVTAVALGAQDDGSADLSGVRGNLSPGVLEGKVEAP